MAFRLSVLPGMVITPILAKRYNSVRKVILMGNIICAVLLSVLLYLMKVEKENADWDEAHAANKQKERMAEI